MVEMLEEEQNDLPGSLKIEENRPPILRFGLQEPMQIGNLVLSSRFHLSPLAGYTNLPMRQTLRELGGLGLATTDLINAKGLLMGSRKSLELIATQQEDRPLAVQIYGNDSNEMVQAAQWLENYGASVIDINMGCPVRKVVKGGGGSAMMCDTTGAVIRLVEKVVTGVKIPVTVKMRLGWDDSQLTAPYFAREFEKIGVKALTIHGRTRAQGFHGKVNRAGIRAVVEAVEKIPIFGNGDIRTITDAEQMFTETGCAGLAIGRGALANPYIFQQLNYWWHTGEPLEIVGYEAHLNIMRIHVQRLIEWRGEKFGCIQFRKIAPWYCRHLRTGKPIQQMLVRLETWDQFLSIDQQLRDLGTPKDWHHHSRNEIPVPAGPISHW